MKEQAGTLDATPSKRLYLSIIADYDTNKAICELVDNALDIWTLAGKSRDLSIDVTLDANQQRIDVSDNAGGVSEADLGLLVAPGHTANPETEQVIGIFGVGTKRAVVALAQQVKITTRSDSDTFQVEFDDTWIQHSDDWALPVYKVPNIPQGTTQIELLRLRSVITEEAISGLKLHLGATYAKFLSRGNVTIRINGEPVQPISFDDWAYPPSYGPRHYSGTLATQDRSQVRVEAIAGLTTQSSPAGGEYGVYFYCNDRLVARGLKTIDVGFGRGLAGRPHADISLARAVVAITGPARLMPWNSSKSDINASHEVFLALRPWLLSVVKDYTSLSRRLSKFPGGWPAHVFRYATGSVTAVTVEDFPSLRTSYLPPLPEAKPRYAHIVHQRNRDLARDRPWTVGLYESMIAVDWILKQRLEQKNRIALLLLDSTIEIALKEFLVNESGTRYTDQRLLGMFQDRSQVHTEVGKHAKIPERDWKKIEHYYNMRCQLIHRRASVSISDREIRDFRTTVEGVLRKLFKLRFN
jgi:hypothetical protein